jgi:hypothetical protein
LRKRVLVVDGHLLYSVDSGGHTKIFSHSNMQYAPAIDILEQVLSGPGVLRPTAPPIHLNCTAQRAPTTAATTHCPQRNVHLRPHHRHW